MIKPEQEFLAHLREGRFMMQRSRATGAFFFPPRIAEPGTGDEELEWIETCGRGTVYATTINRKRPPEPDIHVALIDLEEGPRMMARVEGITPDAVRIGMAVRARIVGGDKQPFVVFDPA